MSFEFPNHGLVFWPVGNGDSTTVVINSKHYLQVDLNHLEMSENNNASWAVINELVKRLPKNNSNQKPYLDAFALTHPDQDHCRGFAELLNKVEIGELWFTPRVFAEYNKELCEDAEAFKKEALRRVQKTIDAKGDPGSGNRVRVFGYSKLLKKDKFKGFPTDRITIPGKEVTVINEIDLSKDFRAFIHAPFKDDDGGDRNDTSLGMQITLNNGPQKLCALLFGDLSYPIINRIFKENKSFINRFFEDNKKDDALKWNVFLAPHHCSKTVMYWKSDENDEEILQKHLIDKIKYGALTPNCIVSSSHQIPNRNEPGDNPPHRKAKHKYEKITDSFICTMEQKEPFVAKIDNRGISFSKEKLTDISASQAANIAQGSHKTPEKAHTYG